MRGNSASFTKSILSNPLVWIGWGLTWFTLHYEEREHAFELFCRPESFRNLIIGALIYVSCFKRQYKKGGEKLDIIATLVAVYETFFTILLTWGLTLGVIVNYHIGGELYRAALHQKYQEIKGEAPVHVQTAETPSAAISEMQTGKAYRVVPQPDGTFLVEELPE